MIRVTIPLSEYSASIAKKGSLYYMYLNPEFLEDDMVSAYEISFGTTEPSEEEIAEAKEKCLRQLKGLLLMNLTAYDTSDAVDLFKFNGEILWKNKTERSCMANAVASAETLEDTKVTLGLGESYELQVQKAKKMLALLEKYALAVYNTTNAHKNAINALSTCEEAFVYDFTVGYPAPLEFDIHGDLISE